MTLKRLFQSKKLYFPLNPHLFPSANNPLLRCNVEKQIYNVSVTLFKLRQSPPILVDEDPVFYKNYWRAHTTKKSAFQCHLR